MFASCYRTAFTNMVSSKGMSCQSCEVRPGHVINISCHRNDEQSFADRTGALPVIMRDGVCVEKGPVYRKE